MTDVRMKELAEKFASELFARLDYDEITEIEMELDMTSKEREYFGWIEEATDFTCEDCPHYYADCYDEDDMFEDGCCYCHYEGRDEDAPCNY